jgi:hypothetical protein
VRGYGWLFFAGILLMMVGFFNIINGIAAIDGTSGYLANEVLFSNLEAWGWFFLIWGIIQVFASFAILSGRSWGVVVGIVTAFFNAIAQLAWLQTNAIWALIAIFVDVLVISGLAVYGGREDATV